MSSISKFEVVGQKDVPEYPIADGERLKSHYFIPWHYNRWLNSDFRMKATAEVRAYAFDLFCVAQNQTPVGTLPDDDEILAKLMMLDLATWKDLRKRSVSPLYGWRHCKCGGGEVRLMHSVVLEMAEGSLTKRKVVVDGMEGERERRRLGLLQKAMLAAGAPARLAENAVYVERLDAFLLEHCTGNRTAVRIVEAMEAMEIISNSVKSLN